MSLTPVEALLSTKDVIISSPPHSDKAGLSQDFWQGDLTSQVREPGSPGRSCASRVGRDLQMKHTQSPSSLHPSRESEAKYERFWLPSDKPQITVGRLDIILKGHFLKNQYARMSEGSFCGCTGNSIQEIQFLDFAP